MSSCKRRPAPKKYKSVFRMGVFSVIMVLVHKADVPIAQQTTTKELPGMPNSTLNDVVFCHVFKESEHIAEARNHHWDKLDPQFFQSIAKRKSNTISAECLNCWSNTPDLLLSSSTRWLDFQPRTLPNVPLVTSSSNPLTSSIAFTTSNGRGSSTGTLATSSMHCHYRLNFPHAPQTLQGRRSPIAAPSFATMNPTPNMAKNLH